MKTAISLFISGFLLIFTSLDGQNIFSNQALRIIEEHKLGNFTEKDSAITYESGSWMPEYLTYQDTGAFGLADLLWEKFLAGEISLHEFPFTIFEDATIDLASSSDLLDPGKFYSTGKEDLENINPGISSIFMIEDWHFDPNAFIFEKKLQGIAPVQIKKKQGPSGNGERYDRIIVGLLTYDDVLQKKYERRSWSKKMLPWKKVEYEFKLVHQNWLKELYVVGTSDRWDWPSPYYLLSSVQWSEAYAQELISGIFEQVQRNNGFVYDFHNGLESSLAEKYQQVFSQELMDRGWLSPEYEEDMDIKFRIMKEDLSKSIYSVIFEEEWFLDPGTLYIQKKVRSIAPVYWKVKYSGENEIQMDETGENPEFEKIPLFRLDFKEDQ